MGQTIRLRINKPIRGHAAGSEIEIATKPDGTPAELFWRRRIRDAYRAEGGDGCVSILAGAGGTPSDSATIAAAPIDSLGGKPAAAAARGK